MNGTTRDAGLTSSVGVLGFAIVLAVVLAACGAPNVSPSTSSTSSQAGPSATLPSASPGASLGETPSSSPGIPGSIAVVGCPEPSASSACLGTTSVPIKVSVPAGKALTLSMGVRNAGGTASSPITVLLNRTDGGPLPLGQPACSACNSTASSKSIVLEWPALAAGETRAITVAIPVIGTTGLSDLVAGLYARPMADVITDQIAGGLKPGQQTWDVALTIR